MDKEIKDLSVKIDKLIELQELILNRLNQGVVLSKDPVEINPINKKLTKKEEENLRIEKYKEEIQLKFKYGPVFQRQFNLVVEPSVERIKAYLKTHSPTAFDGLKRKI